MRGVIALPHLGASTVEAEENCAVMVVEQMREFLENGGISNAVNFPQVEMARESAYRIGIANANVPNMLGQISTAMANAGLNIHNMLNKSRGEMAYTMVDVDSPVAQSVIDAIAAINGVLSVRSIPVEQEAAEPTTFRSIGQDTHVKHKTNRGLRLSSIQPCSLTAGCIVECE